MSMLSQVSKSRPGAPGDGDHVPDAPQMPRAPSIRFFLANEWEPTKLNRFLFIGRFARPLLLGRLSRRAEDSIDPSPGFVLMFLNIEDELLTKASILHVSEVVVSSFPSALFRPADGTLFKKSWKPPQTPLITFIGTCKSQCRTISTENSRTWKILVEAQMLTADIDVIVLVIASMLDVRMVASAFQFNGQSPSGLIK